MAPREHHQPGARSGDVAGKAVSEKIDSEPEQRPVVSLTWYLFTSQSIENKKAFRSIVLLALEICLLSFSHRSY
jgi:hypothetical protein